MLNKPHSSLLFIYLLSSSTSNGI